MWACPSDGIWEYEDIIWRYGYIPVLPSLTDIVAVGFFAAMWRANMTATPVTDAERQTAMDARIALMAKLPPAPPTPRWLVAPNSTSTTRPAYSYTLRTLADGTKQVVLDAMTPRATVGKPCDCAALKYAPSSATYCRLPAASLTAATTVPQPVAVCRLTP
jgi:hypothetical protein